MNFEEEIAATTVTNIADADLSALSHRVVVLTGYAPKLTGATLSDAIMQHIAKSDVSASPYWVQKQQKKRLQPKR